VPSRLVRYSASTGPFWGGSQIDSLCYEQSASGGARAWMNGAITIREIESTDSEWVRMFLMKIVWTVEAESIGSERTRFGTETRVTATERRVLVSCILDICRNRKRSHPQAPCCRRAA